MNWLKKLYCEDWEEVYCPSASFFEAFLFCLSIICAFLLVLIEWQCNFVLKHLLILFPIGFWIFLRASRKDMKATGNMIAGSIGAILGALIVILTKLIPNVFPFKP
jgi:hypothetical protein